MLLIGFVEGLGAVKTYAAQQGYDIDANRELLGVGAANLGSGLMSGMVVNGSLSKTAVNGSAGAKSQVSGLLVAGLTVLTLLFLTGLFEKLPNTVIAAVIDLVDFGSLRSAPLSVSSAIAVAIVFTVVVACSVTVPVIAHLVASRAMAGPLESLRGWLVHNNATVMAVLLLVIGVSVIGKGIGNL